MTATRDTGHDEAAPPLPLPTVPPWVGDLAAALLVVGGLFLPFPGEEFRPNSPLTIALAVTPAVVLPFRRRWPLPALLVCLALYGALSLFGVLSPGAALGASIAMFGYSNRTSRRRAIFVGAGAVMLVLIVSIPAAQGNILDPRVFQFVLAVALATAAGDGARSRRAYVAAITERAERAERTREAEARRRVSEERLRIARDLHDAVAHQIAVISLNAGVASSALDANPEKTRSALSTIRDASRTVLGEIGDLLTMLRTNDPATDSPAAPQPGVEDLDALIDQFRSVGLEVHQRVDGDLAHVTRAASLVVYRVVQEALTNAHKHGAEHRAHVLLEVTDTMVHVVVSNPVSSGRSGDGSGVGLVGLRERVASVRGSVEAGPAAAGWKVSATIPLAKEPS